MINYNLKLFRQSPGSPFINRNFQKELIELGGAPCPVVEIKKIIGTLQLGKSAKGYEEIE